MIRNKSTIQIISRLLMAVFLFVIISPLSVYASGDSASDNDSEDEFESWSDALSDSDYSENLAEMVTKYWISSWLSYVGTGEEVVEDVADFMGDQYDRTVSLYDNLYPYLLPYSRQTVIEIDGSSLSNSIYGKPVNGKNNMKLINMVVKELNDTLEDNSVIINLNKQKNDGYHNKSAGLTNAPELPSYVYFSGTSPLSYFTVYTPDSDISEYFQNFSVICIVPTLDGNTLCQTCLGYDRQYLVNGLMPCLTFNLNNDGVYNVVLNRFDPYTRALESYGTKYWRSYSNNSYNLSRYNTVMIQPEYNALNRGNNYYGGDDCYIRIIHSGSSDVSWYYFDSETLNFTYYGTDSDSSNIDFTSGSNINLNISNIVNSVEFNDYFDFINETLENVSNDIDLTNSLLIQLIQQIQDNQNNYVPTDNDDIYNYISDLFSNMQIIVDNHIEIPDISPDLGGIADALVALLNFLATIIRTVGSIVDSLIQGLLDLLKLLFIPDEPSSNNISIQINNISKPIIWIGDFMDNSKRMISILLLGDDSLNNDGSGDGSGESGSGSGTQDPPVITVDFSNSTSEYDYGGEVAIMDLSWYAPYKSICDPIIVAFCWVMFIVRVVKDIPGIINGFSSNNKEGE